MKALSIRQPWAWLITQGFKDIENRTWQTKFRGQFLIHASKGMTKDEYESVQWYLSDIATHITLPEFGELERGGIVGLATLSKRSEARRVGKGCVSTLRSRGLLYT